MYIYVVNYLKIVRISLLFIYFNKKRIKTVFTKQLYYNNLMSNISL